MERRSAVTFAALSAVAVCLATLLRWLDGSDLQRFIGDFHPTVVFLAVAGLGGVLLHTVLSRAGFVVVRRDGSSGGPAAIGAAIAFGLIIVIADLMIVFPHDINVSFPRSLAFYPAIAFLAEIVFHIVPLSILLVLLRPAGSLARRQLVAVALAGAALPEPVYQTFLAIRSESQGSGAAAFVAVHLLAINGTALWLFRRYDFATMVGFRVAYYLIWHVGWGVLRLHVLF